MLIANTTYFQPYFTVFTLPQTKKSLTVIVTMFIVKVKSHGPCHCKYTHHTVDKRNVTQGAQMMRALYVLWYTKMHQCIETDVC